MIGWLRVTCETECVVRGLPTYPKFTLRSFSTIAHFFLGFYTFMSLMMSWSDSFYIYVLTDLTKIKKNPKYIHATDFYFYGRFSHKVHWTMKSREDKFWSCLWIDLRLSLMAVSIENYVFPRPSMELVVKLQESGVAGSRKND